MLHPSVRPVTPVSEAVLEGHPLHLLTDFTMCKKYKISSIHRSQMEATMTTTKDLWSWGFLTKIVRRQFCPWGSNNIATSVTYTWKMSQEVMLFTSHIRNFVPWKTHRVHLICQTYGVRLIHQKNLKIPALDTKHSQRSLNQNPADGYLPKVVETQEVQRFSEFFFNCLKPSTLSCLKATSIKMYVDPLKEWFWVSNRHPFCPSRTDLGKSIRTSAQGNQGSMKAISPRCPNFGEKNGVYTGNKNTMAWLRHHARVKETHFLFTKSTETKNALSL